MTQTIDQETLEEIRADLVPLVDAYLAAHPEIKESLGGEIAEAAPAVDVVAAPSEAPVDAEPAAKDEDEEGGDLDLGAVLAELFADDDEQDLFDEVVAESVDERAEAIASEDLGLADLFGEDEDEEEEEDDDGSEPLTLDSLEAMFEGGFDDDEIEVLNAAGIVMEYEE